MRLVLSFILVLSVLQVHGQGTPRTLETMAQLLATDPVKFATAGKLVYMVGGYRTNGDWGAPREIHWNSDLVAQTNLGCVWDTITTNGQWVAEDCNGGELDVRWSGAVGDGETDDSVAVQATIDAAPVGGMVVFPTTGPYMMHGVQVRKPLTVTGRGVNTILRINADNAGADHATNNWILKTNVRDDWETNKTYNYDTPDGDVSPGGWLFGVTIKDLTFDGYGRTNRGAGLITERTERSSFQNLKFRAINGPAILIGNSTRESSFTLIKTEDCGAWDTTTKYATLHFLPWPAGTVNFEASNLLTFNQCEFIFSFWHNVYIDSVISPANSSQTIRQIMFSGCNFHEWIFVPSWTSHAAASSIYTYSILPKYNWTTNTFDAWAAQYDGVNLYATGQVTKVIVGNCNFISGGRLSGHVVATDGRNWQFANNRFEGKQDGLPNGSWGAMQLLGASGTYRLSNNSFDMPTSTNLSECSRPWITSANGGRVVAINSEIFDSQMDVINATNTISADLVYDFSARRFRHKIGGNYNGQNYLDSFSTAEPTAKRTWDGWLDLNSLAASATTTNKDAFLRRSQGVWRMQANTDYYRPNAWMDFDGSTTAYGFVFLNPVWNPGTNDFLIGFNLRIPVAAPTNSQGIIALTDGYPATLANRAFGVSLFTNGMLLVSLRGAFGGADFRNRITTANIISQYAGEWMRVVVRRAGGEVSLHANGRELALEADTTGGTPPTSWADTVEANYVVLGVRNGTGETLDGSLGDVWLSDGTVSVQEASFISIYGPPKSLLSSQVLMTYSDRSKWPTLIADPLTQNVTLRDGVSVRNGGLLPATSYPTNNGSYVLFVTNGVASWIAHP